jgi:hypothetical protein
MKPRTLERLVWASSGTFLTIAAAAWFAPVAGTPRVTDAAANAIHQTNAGPNFSSPPMRVVALANGIVERDPFRPDRLQAPLPYSPLADGMPAPPPPPPAPPKPALVLRGTIGGPKWEALLEGIPGRQGSTLVRQGDTLGGLTLRRISRDTVVVRGMDTTWTLTVKRTWP